MGSWLRIRGQVPITISPKGWKHFEEKHGRSLSSFMAEDFAVAFEDIKTIIREEFSDIVNGLGLDTECHLGYLLLDHPSFEFEMGVNGVYDYSHVLVTFNVWDRYSRVRDGLRALRAIQKRLSEIWVYLPLAEWDEDALNDHYKEALGMSRAIQTKISQAVDNDEYLRWDLKEKYNQLLPERCSITAFPTCLKVSSDAEDHFVLFDSGEVYVEKVHDYSFWDAKRELGTDDFYQACEYVNYQRKFDAIKALEVFNRRRPRTRKQKAKKARRLRESVGSVAPRITKEDE